MEKQSKNVLTLYRIHTKACGKTKPTYFPATPKDRKADDCQCPISCHGYLEHVEGRIRHYSLGTSDWNTANERKAAMETAGRKPDQGSDADGITIKHAVADFIKSRRSSKTVNDRTADGYETFFDGRLLPWCKACGKTNLDQITLKDLNDFVFSQKKLKGGGEIDRTTTEKFIATLRAFYAYCVIHEMATVNIAKGLKIGSAVDGDDEGDSGEKIGLEKSEYASVLMTLDATLTNHWYTDLDNRRLRAIIELMRWTGMRISDAEKFCQAELVCAANVGCNANFIQWKLRKLGPKARCIVSVPDHVVKQLKALPHNSESDGKRFFFRIAGVSQETSNAHWRIKITKLFADAQARYGAFTHEGRPKHVTPHSLRHTYAILALNAGADIRDVSKNLGHLKVSTTIAHYSHDTEASKRDREERNRALIQAQMM